MNRAEMQKEIIKKYGGKRVTALKKETCAKCLNWLDCSSCRYRLLPITTAGERCPYFQEHASARKRTQEHAGGG